MSGAGLPSFKGLPRSDGVTGGGSSSFMWLASSSSALIEAQSMGKREVAMNSSGCSKGTVGESSPVMSSSRLGLGGVRPGDRGGDPIFDLLHGDSGLTFLMRVGSGE